MNPDPLREAHQELRKAVPINRRHAAREDGHLHALGRETFRIMDAMKANGETFAQRCEYLIGVLKAILKPVGEPCGCPRCRWACRECEDTGAMLERRPASIYGGKLVDVVAPCHCPKGGRFRPPSRSEDDFTAAGKTKKQRQMTRFGGA